MAVTPSKASLFALGDTVQLTAEVRDQRRQRMEGVEVTWSSSPDSVASVSDSGLVTAVADGRAVVTATAGTISRSAVVTVAQLVVSVAITPDTVALSALGDTVRLSAEPRDRRGNHVVGRAVSWSTSDPAVASVDSEGLVTGVDNGSTEITASADDASGRVAVNVRQRVATATLSHSSVTIVAAASVRLEVRGFDANGHAVTGAPYEWSSNAASVATVNTFGLVTGVREGAATIAAMSESARATAEIVVEKNPDRPGLEAFYESTGGANWARRDRWLTGAPISAWHGVETDSAGRVIRLFLPENGNGLAGSIPPAIGTLTELRALVLAGNELTGPLPAEIGQLRALRELSLAGNGLTGSIPPALANLDSLEVLDLSGNDLEGPIPRELGDLSSLLVLRLNDNSLEGELPPSLGRLGRLHTLELQNNPFDGELPPELGSLSSLEHLNASAATEGPLPAELGGLSRLRTLWLLSNRLSGGIPPELGDLRSLEHLGLCCYLTGPIPPSLGNLRSLKFLYLWHNRLTGSIPQELSELPALETLHVEHNDLTGSLSPAFFEMPLLKRLSVFENDLSGVVDPDLGRETQLQARMQATDLCLAPRASTMRALRDTVVAVAYCPPERVARHALAALYEATGGADWRRSDAWLTDAPLTDWWGVETSADGSVVGLDLSDNGLSGIIPREVTALESLVRLDLGSNRISGPLPPDMADMEALRSVGLGGTGLAGPIPLELTHLRLDRLGFSDTELCAPTTPEFTEWLAALRTWSGALCDPPRDEDHRQALVEGLPERPFEDHRMEGVTIGTLGLGVNGGAFSAISLAQDWFGGSLVAGFFHGEGRVVAFAGQDFIGSQERATLLGRASMDRLLANAVRWAGGGDGAPTAVLVDNERVAASLAAEGLEGVSIAGIRTAQIRDWSQSSLEDVDVAVVQVNEWWVPHLDGGDVVALRAFVEAGGGLLVAGSARHWDFWLEQARGPFPGGALFDGTGISWNRTYLESIDRATTEAETLLTSPAQLWEAYVRGEPIDASRKVDLPSVFEAARKAERYAELDSALSRLVAETPPLPAFATAPEARLAADVAATLGPYEWPEPHPWAATFPGLPADGARPVDGSVIVDATWSEFPAGARRRERRFPLGFYAPPGGLVTIGVPAQPATGALRIAVGQQHDDLRVLPKHATWRRGPQVLRTFDVDAEEISVVNAYGGALALVVPESYAGTIPVTVSGAIPMAVYTAGVSNAADWHATLDAGAPQAIIETRGGIRLVVSAEDARRVIDPALVTRFWEEFRGYHLELAAEPTPRAYESTWIFDPHVGYGGANATWQRIALPLRDEKWVLRPGRADDPAAIVARDEGEGGSGHRPRVDPSGAPWWRIGHELGHQYQTEDWGSGRTYPEIGEVAVNLFTLYTLNHYIYGGSEYSTLPYSPDIVDHVALDSARWSSAEGDAQAMDDAHFKKLQLYRQLIHEFGWSAMRAVFRSYYDAAYPRATYGGALDGFAIRFSAIVRRDLTRFFRHWEYPLTEAAEATIRGFGYEEWAPPDW
ncbi:leucine-rich repeat domain-containing protein [Candidatus Palauibacter sp.]|uniref:leucine-rich repeat domain-containing protein n=1 Tax=Candidatus Palauibacter sp. TaxID=3101350 RepID=UPI003B52D2C1